MWARGQDRRRTARRLIPGLLLALLFAAVPALAQERVSADAIFHPPADFLARFHARCDGRAGSAFTDCFVAAMGEAGATPAALAFARAVQSDGYLAALRPERPVAAALVVYPFRANENWAWLLVNGRPPRIDVDDQRLLAQDALRRAPAYRRLLARYPRLSLWPGRRGADLPTPRRDAVGGERFVIAYQLQDFCHACAVVGRARFAFRFGADGTFLGTRLVAVTPVQP